MFWPFRYRIGPLQAATPRGNDLRRRYLELTRSAGWRLETPATIGRAVKD